MGLTIAKFPTLPTKATNIRAKENTPLEDGEQSPAITSNQPIQTAFKPLLETISDSEDHSSRKNLSRKQ